MGADSPDRSGTPREAAGVVEALDERAATVFVYPTSPCCFESFGLALPAPMIESPFDTTRAAASLLYSCALARHPRIAFILPRAGGTLRHRLPVRERGSRADGRGGVRGNAVPAPTSARRSGRVTPPAGPGVGRSSIADGGRAMIALGYSARCDATMQAGDTFPIREALQPSA